MERNFEKEKKEKEQLERYISNKLNQNNYKTAKVENTESNIMDLLYLANSELESKSKHVAELENKLVFLQGNNIRSLSEHDLNNLKDFYSSKLGLVIDTLTNLNNSSNR